MERIGRKMISVGRVVLFVSAVIFLSCGKIKEYSFQGEGAADFPDAVSSIVDGKELRLIIVANADRIENIHDFAKQAVRKYESNSFCTTKFSTDQGQMPARVYMRVYLKREDIGERPSLFSIIYDTEKRRIKIER